MSELNNKINELRTLKKSYSDLADSVQSMMSDGIVGELTSAKQQVIKSLQDKGSDVADNATLIDVADKIDKLVVVPQGQFILNGEFKNLENLLSTKSAIDTFYSEAKSFWYTNYNNSFMYFFCRLFSVKNYILPNFTSNGQESLPSYTGVRYIYAPSIYTAASPNTFLPACDTLICADIRNATSVGSYFLRVARSIRHLFYNAHAGSNMFYDANTGLVLYDIRKTLPYRSNVVYTPWKATTALSMSSTSILTKDEWDDPNEPTETFTCNRDKFMWYFKNHFMQDFADMSDAETPPTLTLYSAMYDVVMADEEIVNHFSSRGWTVAKG
jgi:hypothetical protein